MSTKPKEKHELLCEVCDRYYPVWYAPNPLWNQVMRWPDGREESEKVSFICPTCFAIEAGRRGATAGPNCIVVTTDAASPQDTTAEDVA